MSKKSILATVRKKNDDILKKFADSDSSLNLVLAVDMLTTGVDLPNIDWMMILRKKASNPDMIWQMVGRALRKNTSDPNKVAKIYLCSELFDDLGHKIVYRYEDSLNQDIEDGLYD